MFRKKEIEIFRRFWPNLKFSPITTKIAIFSKIFTKTEILEDFVQNRGITKIFTKIETFKDFDQNRYFSKIMTKIAFFSRKFDIYEDFSKTWPKSRFSENVHQNGDFSKILTKIEIFEKFYQNRDIPKIFIQIEIVKEFDQNRFFFLTFGQNPDISKICKHDLKKNCPKSRFLDIWTEIEMFRIKSKCFKNYYQTWNFREFWPKSLFFENVVQNWYFRRFWPKSRYLKIFT